MPASVAERTGSQRSEVLTGAGQRLRRAVVRTVLRRGAVLAVLVVVVGYLVVPQLVVASRSLDLLGRRLVEVWLPIHPRRSGRGRVPPH
jgi:hypothetical protein